MKTVMAKYKVKTRDCQLIVGVRLSLKEKINVTQLDFFSNRYIRGLLKVKMIKKSHIEYYGPIGISLYERLKKPISKYDFLFIMEQVVDTVQKLNANSLIINNVIFDIKNVFINEITKELQFIYLPLENVQKETDIIGFMEQIIYASKPQQENDMEYVSRYVYFVKSLTKFDANKIEKYIQNEDRSVVNTIKRRNVGQSGYITDKPADYYNHYSNKEDEATGLLEDEATGLLEDEATGLLVEDEATGLLMEEQQTVHYASLYRLLTNEVISINKPVFRIGKERRYSDYFVANNDKVSRSHADIITRRGRYFIVDLNSKNGTYINDVPVPVQQEVEIHFGDRIRLANDEFEFRS